MPYEFNSEIDFICKRFFKSFKFSFNRKNSNHKISFQLVRVYKMINGLKSFKINRYFFECVGFVTLKIRGKFEWNFFGLSLIIIFN